jgi:Disulphide bond corrector protein DsbC
MNQLPAMLTILPLSLALAVLPVTAQAPLVVAQSHATSGKPTAVTYLFPEQITLVADKPTAVDLHFKVAAGLHVNSHTPHAEELIPTTLKLPETSGVRLSKAAFPPGTDYAFAINPQEKLSVYTGEFTIHAELVAAKGEHLVEGTLHYQACNNESCMPPHSIPVAIDVIAK